MRKTRVSVLIVNWNGKEHLEACFGSLAAQTFKDFEVILVDNGSQDGSVTFVRDVYPWVNLVPLPDNIGFAGGNNRGYSHAVGDYIVTLNNDTRVDEKWLEELIAVADAYPQAGMIASRVCFYDKPEIVDSLGMRVCKDGMSRSAGRLKTLTELTVKSVEEIFFPNACAALYKREMIEEIGFFDEDFFAYCEDTDLGLRGRWAGWDALLAADAIVYHKYSQSGGEFSPFKLYLVERNHFWVVAKNFPLANLCMLPLFTLGRYVLQAFTVFSSQGCGREFRSSASSAASLRTIAKGILDAVLGLSPMFRKRMRMRPLRSLSSTDMQSLLNQYSLTFRELLDLNV